MIGPHALGRTDAIIRWCKKTGIVKQAFDTNVLKEAKQNNPTILTICRPKWMLRTDSGIEAAKEIIQFYKDHQFIPDYTELWNESDEIGQNLGNGLERRLELHQEAVPVLRDAGIAVAGFSFSVGQPQPNDIAYLEANNWAGIPILALHEYWFQPPPFDTWTALRYRRITSIPIIITECGRHYNGSEDWGWKACGITAQEYANELNQYSSELEKDGVKGVVFTSGNSMWDSFNTDPLVDLIKGVEMPYLVGTGIKDAMDRYAEQPEEDEHYLWKDMYSICASNKALYIYCFAANKVYRCPLA